MEMVATRNLEHYAQIHNAKAYGRGNSRVRRAIAPWVRLIKPQTILDYGAGQSTLLEQIAKHTPTRDRFDPAIPAISSIPRTSYDVVVSVDVLEHLDVAEIDAVLADIKRLTNKAILVADTRKASLVLPNGENAHATIQPPAWWLQKIRSVFPDAIQIASAESNAIFATWEPTLLQRTAARVLKPFLRTGIH